MANNSDSQKLLAAAVAGGEWMLANQINPNRFDANRGRGLCSFDLKTGHTYLTSGWMTGVQAMALLALFKRTGEKKYLEAAERAGRYILTLQVMDARQPRYYGVFREITPQSQEFCPRDATTSAWALVWLYEATRTPFYLDRANLFGEWHLNHGMYDGWPLYMGFMDCGLQDIRRKGSFQSGAGLFHHDLFMAGGNAAFIERGLCPIARRYRDEFFHPDGRIIQSRDGFSNAVVPADPEQELRQDGMHLFNDDFGNAMLQAAADLFQDESYRAAAVRNAHWLARQQAADGGFGDQYPSGVPVAAMYFHDLGRQANDTVLLAARDKAAGKLLALQVTGTGDRRADGAFRGVYAGPPGAPGGGEICVDMRTSAYAIMALLKLESDLAGIWLGRHNQRYADVFPDPIDDYLPW
jgi:hypothetical protein